MENFEKCTVAMLGGPCSQHVTGNTSRLNQPQSAIMPHTAMQYVKYGYMKAKYISVTTSDSDIC